MNIHRLLSSLRSTLLVATAALSVGCSSGSEPASAPTGLLSQSSPILSVPPQTCELLKTRSLQSLWINDEEDRIEWKKPDGSLQTLVLESKILMLASLDIEAPSNEEWLVGAIDSSEVWHLYHVKDTDGDGFPNQSSATLLLDTGTSKAYITDVVRSSQQSSTIFLLDRRCQDILLATDSDADGLADDLESTPFAMSASFPRLLDCRMLHEASDDSVTVLVSPNQVPRAMRGPCDIEALPRVRYEDTDSDKVAESEAESVPPLHAQIRGHCRAGMSELEVVGDVGETVQIWDVPGTGSPTLLGSKTLTSAATDLTDDASWETVTLSRNLLAGETIRVAYASGSVFDYELKVGEDGPDLYRVGSGGFNVSLGGGTYSLHGRGFVSGDSVHLKTMDGNEYALATTFENENELEFVVPGTLLAADEGVGELTVHRTVGGVLTLMAGAPVLVRGDLP